MTGPNDYYKSGDWNATCFICGRKFKASEMVRNWEGFYTCKKDFTPRQPQDFARGIPDNQSAPWTQPMPADTFVALCTPNSRSAYPGYAGPGCCIPGYVDPLFDPDIDY